MQIVVAGATLALIVGTVLLKGVASKALARGAPLYLLGEMLAGLVQ